MNYLANGAEDSVSDSEQPVQQKYVEVYFVNEDFSTAQIEGELKALEFRAPWVSVMLSDGAIYHLPVVQVLAIRITDKKENI